MNFGPGPQGGFYNALALGQQTGDRVLNSFMQGRQMAEQRNERNALAAYAKDPSEASFAGLADVRPDLAIQVRGQQASQADAARKQQMEQMGTFRQLLEQAGSNPQQAFAAAQQLGLDVSGVPQPGTPEFEPWRQSQLFIMDALEKEGDNLPGLAQEVMLALPEDQRDPNSPMFRQAFTAALENKYAAEYTDAQGNTRRRAIIGQPQQQAPAQAQAPSGEVMNFEALASTAQQLGPERSQAFIGRLIQGGVRIAVSTPDQARQLPRGTPIVLPDGTPGVVP
jgi:hypothetical protein